MSMSKKKVKVPKSKGSMLKLTLPQEEFEFDESSKSLSKTEIILGDFSSNPNCAHGPAVLFSRDGNRFYACAAYRSRKLCSFYMKEDRWLLLEKAKSCGQDCEGIANEESSTKEFDRPRPSSAHSRKRSINIIGKSGLNPDPVPAPTKKEKIDESPKERTLNKGQAQYFFSKQSLEFVANLLETLGIRRVICVGVPTFHFRFMEHKSMSGFQSYLLDIDIQFVEYPNFSQFNMCNYHFFSETDRGKYLQFLRDSCDVDDKLAVICDPPFGARLELVLNTISLIIGEWRDLVSQQTVEYEASETVSEGAKVILVHPYFSEGKILRIDPTLKMCDYKIEYESHKKFKHGTKSPVRLFTNIPLNHIQFPESDTPGEDINSGEYKYCSLCKKYVFRVSQHCKVCNSCTSRDGRQTRHCYKCGYCIKESWAHCSKCSRCHFPGNQCKQGGTRIATDFGSQSKSKVSSKMTRSKVTKSSVRNVTVKAKQRRGE